MVSIRKFPLGLCLLATLLIPALPALAQPPIWEGSYGPALAALTGGDDEETSVVLSFSFPYGANSYTTVFVGDNGCIQLGSLGTDGEIDYDHWSYFEEFYADAAPEICPINTDWDASTTGTVHFNDFGNRAVFTWNEIGTNANETALATFQVQLESTGRIVFGYNGILDGKGEDLLTDLDQGLVVGITSSDGADPGPTDLSPGTFAAGGTVYERWCYDTANSCTEGGGGGTKAKGRASHGSVVEGGLPGPINTAFDLDQTNVIFTPGGGPSIVEVPTLDGVGLAGLALLLGTAAFVTLRRRSAAR